MVLLHLRFERSTARDTKGFSRERCNKRVSMGIPQINTQGKTEHKAWYTYCFSLLKFKQPNHLRRTKPAFQTESASPGDTQLSPTLWVLTACLGEPGQRFEQLLQSHFTLSCCQICTFFHL